MTGDRKKGQAREAAIFDLFEALVFLLGRFWGQISFLAMFEQAYRRVPEVVSTRLGDAE